MTIEQARIRARQLNAQINLKRYEEKRLKSEAEVKEFELKCVGFLPEPLLLQFEERYFAGSRLQRVLKNKELSHWRAAQKLIFEIQLEPSDWYDETHRIYDWFHKQRFELSYVKKIIRIMNLWGFFISRKLGKPFFSVKFPRGLEKDRLLNAYFTKMRKTMHQSDPLQPAQLEKAKPLMGKRHFNWLYLSVWLGLRPLEIDQLKDRQRFRLRKGADGKYVLWVFQRKLTSLPHRYLWKLIPLFLKQHSIVPQIIKSGEFQRPLVKSIKRYFGESTTLYGGRKDFTDLMLSFDQDFFNISQWMGHSSIDRTWKNYKSRVITHYSI